MSPRWFSLQSMILTVNRLTESTSESSDDELLAELPNPDEAKILAAFPDDMLTDEVWANVINCLEHCGIVHSETQLALKEVKKLIRAKLLSTLT